MSNVNIKRLVENIRSGTNSYTPLVELVVNGIQAIEQKGGDGNGLVEIEVLRNGQPNFAERIEEVDGFIVRDNGIGFTRRNRDAFDTLYTDLKAADGGKGFGRFTCLKYFERLKVESTFERDGALFDRTFSMGLGNQIIVDESECASTSSTTGSAVEISRIKSIKFPDKGLEVISRVVVERLLPYFVERPCPRIVIRDVGTTNPPISLNDYLSSDASQIAELPVPNPTFTFTSSEGVNTFRVRVFKFYAPRSSRSKVSLVAHRREVTENPLQNYIPEFSEEFYEPVTGEDGAKGRNFVIKAYVFGDYLNDNVSLERGEFRFQADSDLFNGISQSQIEQRAAEIAQSVVGDEIAERRKRKQARIVEYVETQAPWHRTLSKEVDFSALSMNPSPKDIELHLQTSKFEKEIATRDRVSAILSAEDNDSLHDQIAAVVSSISETSKSDLIHYVSMRRCVLDLFSKALEARADGKYRSEGDVHDIIIQRKADSDELDFESHNLWMLDERLNFSSYFASDKPAAGSRDRTDVTIYNRPVVFRGENEASNPITIFEFKKPQRDDFANPSSKEDPVQQIIRYVNQIRDGKVKTVGGRNILVASTTPFYGYVVCDLTPKVKKWLEFEQNFTPMPDGLGWFQWRGNINLYIEVNSWDKLLRDAEMRNKIFFHKLGID